MLKHLFFWLGKSWLGVQMSQSTYGFAIVEMFHLIALALLGGVILVIDLRLLGIGFRQQAATDLVRELSPVLYGSLACLFVSGVLMVASEAMKCYYNPAFRLKMILLIVAIAFYFALHRRLITQRSDRQPTWWTKSAAVVSLVLWLGVGLSGRAIGFI